MASVLLCALAGMGVAEHLVNVAAALRSRGHRVSVATSPNALESYTELDVELHAAPEPPMPEMLDGLPPLLQRAQQLYARVQRNIIDPLPEQARIVEAVIHDAAVDVIVTDALFLGGSMVSIRPRASRPAVIMLGAFAPWLPDPHVPPYGLGVAPADNEANRARSAAFEFLTARAYTRLSRSFNAKVEAAFGTSRTGDLRSSPAGADVWAQLTVPRFEYPRTALPTNFQFVGPLHPSSSAAIPTWWDPAREPPVVLVRATNEAAVHDLILPTIRAFATTGDVVVVVGATREAVSKASPTPLPSTVHFEECAPWPRLIPRRTIVMSDGDYLNTQHALRYGIPVVIAGTLETDVETAARVEWAGVGVNLRTRRPTPELIRTAAQRIRADGSFQIAAAKIAAQISTTDAEATLCRLVDDLMPRH